MLNRKVTNFIRFVLDELLPPILRDNYYFMYPLFWIWFKGKNVKRFMNFKSVFHQLSEDDFAGYYRDYEYIANRDTDLSNQSIEYIIKQLGNDKNISIVDVGCGTGYVIKQIQNEGYSNVCGIDLVPRSEFDSVEIKTGNIESLPFPDNAFDVVICSHTLEHVLDLPKAISELKRLAKTKLIITVPKQRYYQYTFDLHIHFFPQISYLLKYIGIDETNVQYKSVSGDWTVVCNTSNL